MTEAAIAELEEMLRYDARSALDRAREMLAADRDDSDPSYQRILLAKVRPRPGSATPRTVPGSCARSAAGPRSVTIGCCSR